MTTMGGPVEPNAPRPETREWHVRVRSGDLDAELMFVVAPTEEQALAIGRSRVDDPRALATATEVVMGL
jgi:hypothetical protein